MAISPPPLPPAIIVISQFTYMVLATRAFYIECEQDHLGSCHLPLLYTFTTSIFERLHKYSGFFEHVILFGEAKITSKTAIHHNVRMWGYKNPHFVIARLDAVCRRMFPF